MDNDRQAWVSVSDTYLKDHDLFRELPSNVLLLEKREDKANRRVLLRIRHTCLPVATGEPPTISLDEFLKALESK